MTDTTFDKTSPDESAAKTYGDFGEVRAEHVELTQGGAKLIEARTVTLQQGGAGSVRAGQLSVSQGGVGVARTDRLEIGENGSALFVLADRVTVAPDGRVLLLIARTAEGGVRPVLDFRGAAAIAGGLVAAVLLLRARR